jgi:hypothetical protein
MGRVKFTTLIAFMSLSAAMIGCGSDNEGTSRAYQQGSSNCSQEFVGDYNTITIKARSMMTTADVEELEALVKEFAEIYKDVVCNAKVTKSGELKGREQKIDVNAWTAELLEILAGAR